MKDWIETARDEVMVGGRGDITRAIHGGMKAGWVVGLKTPTKEASDSREEAV